MGSVEKFLHKRNTRFDRIRFPFYALYLLLKRKKKRDRYSIYPNIDAKCIIFGIAKLYTRKEIKLLPNPRFLAPSGSISKINNISGPFNDLWNEYWKPFTFSEGALMPRSSTKPLCWIASALLGTQRKLAIYFKQNSSHLYKTDSQFALTIYTAPSILIRYERYAYSEMLFQQPDVKTCSNESEERHLIGTWQKVRHRIK